MYKKGFVSCYLQLNNADIDSRLYMRKQQQTDPLRYILHISYVPGRLGFIAAMITMWCM